MHFETARSPDDLCRVVVLLANDMSPQKWTATMEALRPMSVESVNTTASELSFAIHTLLELSKPAPVYDIDYYGLDYVSVILTYPSVDEFKSRNMLTTLSDLPELKGHLRFSDTDQLLTTMINDKYNEVSNAIAVHEENLDTWSDNEPAALKDAVVNARDANKKTLTLLADISRELKTALVNALT